MKFASALLLTLVVLQVCRPILANQILNAADDAEFWNPAKHGRRFGLAQAAEGFSYDFTADNGPHNWVAVDAQCGGNAQSPIDINAATFDPALQALNFNYRDFNGAVFFNNNGESLRVDFTDPVQSILTGGALQNGQSFRVANIHFHTPSDHTISGGQFPLELHIVHVNTNPALALPNNTNELTVVSTLFRLGDANPWLTPFVNAVNAGGATPAVNLQSPGGRRNLTGTLRLQDILPNPAYYYTYPGSLTTPGCRQTVTWHVLRNIQTASGAQIQALRSPFSAFPNSRPVQPLNNRIVRTNLPFSVGTVGNPGVAANSPVVNINFANIYPAARV
jgi:carbonic anhydrase